MVCEPSGSVIVNGLTLLVTTPGIVTLAHGVAPTNSVPVLAFSNCTNLSYLRGPLITIFYCKITLWSATASDFTKNPQRSVPYTSAGFLLIVLVSTQIVIFRDEHGY